MDVPVDAEIALSERSDRIAELYAKHAPRAGRLAYLLTGDRHLAEDLAQEAFVRSAGRIRNLRNPEVFDAYLRRTVVNLTRKHWRRKANERKYLARQNAATALPIVDLPDVATREQIWAALEMLPYEQRAAIVLRYFNDLSERDAAAALGCPQGTLKSRVSRGLQTLRIQMRGDDNGSS